MWRSASSLGVLAALLLPPVGCRRTSSVASTSEPVSNTLVSCAPGYEPLAGACFATPAIAGNAPVLVYLHGRYAKDAFAEEVERAERVAKRATARGFVVLAPRSPEGGCGEKFAGYYCWPSNEATIKNGTKIVGDWAPALEAVAKRTQNSRRFVLGFSSGAFFAGFLATRAMFAANAFAIAHGGISEPFPSSASPAPLLLLSAFDDVSLEGMRIFDTRLSTAKWPHDSYARPGGHALTDGDIDAVLAFFERAPKEGAPLRPPLALGRMDQKPASKADSSPNETQPAPSVLPSAADDVELERVQDASIRADNKSAPL